LISKSLGGSTQQEMGGKKNSKNGTGSRYTRILENIKDL